MDVGGRVRLFELKQQYGGQLLSVLTILLAMMLFVVAPIQAAGFFAIDAFGGIVALVMVACALVISGSPTITAIMLVGCSLNVIVVVLRLVRPLPYDLYILAAAWAMITTTLGIVVARQVFERGQVGFHRIIGAI